MMGGRGMGRQLVQAPRPVKRHETGSNHQAAEQRARARTGKNLPPSHQIKSPELQFMPTPEASLLII